MKSGLSWIIVVLLLVVVGVLAWMLYATPVVAPTIETATSTGALNDDADITPTTGALHERVRVTAPESGQPVFQNFSVTGEAPGNWYFEASFPIKIVDPNGNTVATGIATALTEWMTTEQVPFKADITVASYTGPATLVLLRDNPSGLPENDDSLSIPIVIQ